MKKVEQVTNDIKIIEDYDKILSKSQVKNKFEKLFENIKLLDNLIIINDCVSILCANITYLGHPHPLYKKRIQLKNYYIDYYNINLTNDIRTYFIGIYSYENNFLYCVINPENFKNNKFNNSSVHIYTTDLLEARSKGISKRIDKNNNEIIVMSEDRFVKFIDSSSLFKEVVFDEIIEDKVIDYVMKFWSSLYDEYYGIESIQEMIDNNFENAYQSEWFGFYFEYLFQKFLSKNKTDVIKIYGDKQKGGIDLDLKINNADNYYADLKTHSNEYDILGNDYETVRSVVDTDGTILYISVSYSPEYDKEYGGEVTKFWNAELNKRDNKNKKIDSYLNKMKYSVKLDSLEVLKINKDNFKYLDIFNQGKNSDGNSRKTKIKINKKKLDIFTIKKLKKS